MKKEVGVGIVSLNSDYNTLVQELLKIKQQCKNIVVYTTLLSQKEQELAFAALELGIPYYVFVYDKEYEKYFSQRDYERFCWLQIRAKKIKVLRRDQRVKHIAPLLKKVIKMCDIILRI